MPHRYIVVVGSALLIGIAAYLGWGTPGAVVAAVATYLVVVLGVAGLVGSEGAHATPEAPIVRAAKHLHAHPIALTATGAAILSLVLAVNLGFARSAVSVMTIRATAAESEVTIAQNAVTFEKGRSKVLQKELDEYADVINAEKARRGDEAAKKAAADTEARRAVEAARQQERAEADARWSTLPGHGDIPLLKGAKLESRKAPNPAESVDELVTYVVPMPKDEFESEFLSRLQKEGWRPAEPKYDGKTVFYDKGPLTVMVNITEQGGSSKLTMMIGAK